jgi:hypothetical protein
VNFIAEQGNSGFILFAFICHCAARRCSWMPEESPVESSEHQDNANIHGQPFPESVSEER